MHIYVQIRTSTTIAGVHVDVRICIPTRVHIYVLFVHIYVRFKKNKYILDGVFIYIYI